MPGQPRWADALSLGAWTDISVNVLSGSEVTDNGDHLVIRTPANPSYVWGNCIQALEDPDDVDRWLRAFGQAFADPGHIAIGLSGAPSHDQWVRRGLQMSVEDVLTATSAPDRKPAPPGVEVRPFVSDDDWAAVVDLFVEDNERAHDFPGLGYGEFVRRRGVARRAMVERGEANFFGAWHEGRLVGHVGIVLCGEAARYQSVLIRAENRRQGVASHLITTCGAWAADQGVPRQVILAEADSDAGRLYGSLGFAKGHPIVGVELFE